MTTCYEPDFRAAQIGAVLVLTVKDKLPDGTLSAVDMSVATTKEVHIKRPDGSVLTLVAAFAGVDEGGTGDGTDGKIKVTTTAVTDLPDAGDYVAQPWIEIPGFFGPSYAEPFRFSVGANVQ